MTDQKPTKYVDLHLHTRFSDGTDDPKSLVRAVKFSGIDVMSITDHDTMKGYFDAKDEARKYDIQLIPGVEVSTEVYHILGLNVFPNHKGFQEFLGKVQSLQEKVCEQRIVILQRHGVPITMDKLRSNFPESRLGKYNIFMTMLMDDECRQYLKKNAPVDVQEAFQYYLGKKGIAGKVEKIHYVTSKEAIDEIHTAGGIAVIAHPFKEIKSNIKDTLDKLVYEEGIDAIEVQPNFGDANLPFIEYAKANGIPLTYGSDYHGAGFPRKLIGRGENKVEDIEMILAQRRFQYA